MFMEDSFGFHLRVVPADFGDPVFHWSSSLLRAVEVFFEFKVAGW